MAEEVMTGEDAQPDAKIQERVALGVAAHTSCQYSVYAHTKLARATGVSKTGIREAVTTAADIRHWSNVLKGRGYDFDTFKKEVDELIKPWRHCKAILRRQLEISSDLIGYLN